MVQISRSSSSSNRSDKAFFARAKRFWSSGLVAFSFLFGAQNLAAQSEPSPGELVDALHGVFGRHAKQRGSHAKGFCVSGYFVPSEESKGFSSTALFTGPKIPVTARFSIGGGNPNASDKGRSVRGLGIRFHISGGEALDLVLISAPVFFAATPAQFVAFLKARTPDPVTGKKNPDNIKAFNQSNPNVMPHLNYLAQTPPPASYASTPYFSTHAFFFDQKENQKQAARWILEPKDGFQGLTPEQEKNFPTSFLEKEMTERLANAPAIWDVFLQIPQDTDSLTDPSSVWPETRERKLMGRLVISRKIVKGSAQDCTGLIFDPNRLPQGITPTDDPILAARSPAYGVSFGRRSQ